MARGVGHRRDVEAKLEVAVEKAAVQSWNCGDGDARGGGAHDGGGAHSMSGKSVEAAIAGLGQGQYGNRCEYVVADVSTYVAVAVVVELYNASAASAAVAVAAAAACAMRIPFPSTHFPLSRVHLARTWVRWDARFLSLAPSH